MVTKKEKYNSPSNKKTPTLFTKSSLVKLINTWNSSRKSKIEYKNNYSAKKLSELLNDNIKSICDDNEYWCWP